MLNNKYQDACFIDLSWSPFAAAPGKECALFFGIVFEIFL